MNAVAIHKQDKLVYLPIPAICSTAECSNAAKNILGKIDETVKPCDNFYNFACGQYIKDTVVPEDKTVVDTFSAIRDALNDQMQTIITAPIEKTDIEPFKMVKKLYNACFKKGKSWNVIAQLVVMRTNIHRSYRETRLKPDP